LRCFIPTELLALALERPDEEITADFNDKIWRRRAGLALIRKCFVQCPSRASGRAHTKDEEKAPSILTQVDDRASAYAKASKEIDSLLWTLILLVVGTKVFRVIHRHLQPQPDAR